MHIGIPSDMKEIKCDFSLKISCSTVFLMMWSLEVLEKQWDP